MKVLMRSLGGLCFRAVAGALLMCMALSSLAGAQAVYSGRVIDPRSPLSQDILDLLVGYCPGYGMPELERVNRDVQMTAADYNVDPGLLLALMAGEERYPSYPQARLYYFNLDMGPAANAEDFPPAWLDSERVARAYSAEYRRYEDRALAVTAYYLGYQQVPSGLDLSALNEAQRDLISMVLTLDAELSHLGERSGPQVLETGEDTPQDAFEQPEYDLTEIQRKYIENMVHFNSRLDDPTALEIFEAIRVHAEAYSTVDARLVMALVACESSFRPDAVSRCGAEGLGQLMPFTSARFGVDDPFDIDENIRATFAYLEREFSRWADYNYTLDRVLAAYNAGPNAVERYNDPPYDGIPPYEETVNYVGKVVNNYYWMLPEEEREARIRGESRHYEAILAIDRAGSQ